MVPPAGPRSGRLRKIARRPHFDPIAAALPQAKRDGIADRQIAERLQVEPLAVREARKKLGVRAVFNRVDTCAAEFESFTPYLYSSYESECEAAPTIVKRS